MRKPYRFGDEVEESVRKLLQLRYRLLPYIYSSAYESVQTGVPFLRPMPLEFDHDPNVANMADQFMFGSALLVAPFLKEGGTRIVYLPEGDWYDYWTGIHIQGSTRITAEMDIDRFPLYVRGGSIIPLGPVMQYTDEMPCDPLTLLLYPNGESRFEYYDDHEVFLIELDEFKLTIGEVKDHRFHLVVYTNHDIQEVWANGKRCPFHKEDYGFRCEYVIKNSKLQIEWRS